MTPDQLSTHRMHIRASLCVCMQQLVGRRHLPAQAWHLVANLARDLGAEALETLAHRRFMRRVMLALRTEGQRA
ncbi:hypothetical protein [Falsiroseomonas sp.]|uniref:hypothetical protein n=1 Tax=Falsiroseomonas sp. TaxID=2870721 RepID=UPI003F715BAA